MVLALIAAVLLAGALVRTSFSAASPAVSPSTLLATGRSGESYELTGKVVAGYYRDGTTLVFEVRDRTSGVTVPVRYRGSVPDPFRADREVIVTVRRHGRQWIGERDSLITKCPSKFSSETERS